MKPVLKAAGEGRQRAVERKLYEDLTCHTMDNDITCNIEYYIDDEFHPHRSDFFSAEPTFSDREAHREQVQHNSLIMSIRCK